MIYAPHPDVTLDLHSPSAFQGSSNLEVQLPADLFQKFVASERMKIIHFRSSKLFHPGGQITDWEDTGDVLSISIIDRIKVDLTECLEYYIPNKQVW